MNILDPWGKKSTRRFNLNFINFLQKGDEKLEKAKNGKYEKCESIVVPVEGKKKRP